MLRGAWEAGRYDLALGWLAPHIGGCTTLGKDFRSLGFVVQEKHDGPMEARR